MGINIGGMAAAYRGFTDEQRRIEDDERRREADARAKQAADFAEEVRSRERKDWREADRIKAEDKADLAAVTAKYQQQVAQGAAAADAASPTANASAPLAGGPPPVDGDLAGAPDVAPAPDAAGVPAKPAGLPKARNFNAILDIQSEVLRNKAARGTLSVQDYAQGMKLVNTMRDEGVNEALKRINAGDYEGGMDAFNRVGQHGNARIVKGEAGTTKINGQDVPTHHLVIANPDGSRTEIDSAKAQYQLMDLNSQLAHMDRSRQLTSQEKYQGDSLKLQRDQLAQHAADSAAARGLQREQIALHRAQIDAATPLGQITAMQKALGRPLNPDEIENRLGLSKIPRAVELQVQDLLKQNEAEAQILAKAIASPEGVNPAAQSTFDKNAAIRSARLRQLLEPFSTKQGGSSGASGTAGTDGGSADVLGFRAAQGVPSAPPAAPVQTGALKAAGGVRAPTPAPAASAPQTALPPGTVDVREDTVLASLRRSIAALDANDPANLDTIMKLGKARNDRIDQLQANYGAWAKLITD